VVDSAGQCELQNTERLAVLVEMGRKNNIGINPGSFGGLFAGLLLSAPGGGHSGVDLTLGHFVQTFLFGLLADLGHDLGQIAEHLLTVFWGLVVAWGRARYFGWGTILVMM
jgi:hypothetical protein